MDSISHPRNISEIPTLQHGQFMLNLAITKNVIRSNIASTGYPTHHSHPWQDGG